jgi:dipeptidyl aminopeptidase/acylaminoacyl peptidase
MSRLLCSVGLTSLWLALPTLVTAQSLNPSENLVLKGIPPIPTQLVEKVSRYTNFRAAGLSSWHPLRSEMLISTRFGDTPQIHLVKNPLGMRKQLTFATEGIAGGKFEPVKGNYLVFSKDIGGNEFNQLYRYDLSSGETTLLTDGKSKNSGGTWSNKGKLLAYTSTRRTGQDNDFYVVDPTQPHSTKLIAQATGGGWGVADWSPDDRQLLAIEYVSANESYLWSIDLATGQKKLMMPKSQGIKVSYQSAIYSQDGRGLYIVTDQGSEFSRLAYLDLATKKSTFLTSQIKWDVEDVDLSKNGRSLAFTTNEDGAAVLHILDTKTRQLQKIPKLPVGQVSGLQWHPNGRDLGFNLSAGRSTADVYVLNVPTGKLVRWTESETGGINTQKFAEAERIQWPSFDQKKISGFIYRPAAQFQGKRPVIIDIHGGPEAQFRPGFLGRNNYYLNDLGVALIFPNVRGSAGYGKTFLKLDNGFQREDSVKDIGALLDWIARQPDLDKDRILVRGGSYGGYMSLAVATTYSDRIRGAINIVGISNFVSFLERTEGYRRDLRRVEYGDERDPQMRSFLTKISPLNSASKIKKPLFVIHGKNDPRVPLNEAEQIVSTLEKSSTPVWYLMAKDEGHGFGKKKNQDFQFYSTVLFTEKYLLNANEVK